MTKEQQEQADDKKFKEIQKFVAKEKEKIRLRKERENNPVIKFELTTVKEGAFILTALKKDGSMWIMRRGKIGEEDGTWEQIPEKGLYK